MKHDTFSILVEKRLEACKKVLINKDKEYSSDEDRLHNFKQAGKARNKTDIEALDGMWMKHIVSIWDAIDKMSYDKSYTPSEEWVKEKLGDNINYTLLLEGLIEDRREIL